MTDGAVEAPKRILVTDDDPSIRRLVAAILRREKFDVDTASGGRDAIEKINQSRYDVVVLDLMMPEVSGFDVLAALKDRDGHPKFVVVMSAASQNVIADALDKNVFAALRKPFEVHEMISTVRACIASTANPADPVSKRTYAERLS